MYSDNEKKRPVWLAPLAVLVLILAIAGAFALARPGQNLREDGAVAIREAVRRSALQCYVVEGIYPPDLQYLEDNYGLQVNTKEYYVTYDAFASNLPPTVKVTKK